MAGDAIKYLTVDQISTVFLIHFCTQVRYAVTEQQLSVIVQNCSYCTFSNYYSRKPCHRSYSLGSMFILLLFICAAKLRLSLKIWEMRISGHIQKFKHTHTHTHTKNSRGFWERGRTVHNHKDWPHTLALTCTPTYSQRQAIA